MTAQDTTQQELRARIAKTKTFNYDVYHGQDIANNCIPFEEALDEIQSLVNAEVRACLERLIVDDGAEVHSREWINQRIEAEIRKYGGVQ